MDLNNKNVARWSVRGLTLIGVGILIAVLLSSYYYRSLELHPIALWHGANMGARSLLSDSKKDVTHIDIELISRVSDKLDKGQLNHSVHETNTSQITMPDIEIKNQLATNQARNRQLQHDLNRLELANDQLLNSKSTLDSLNQDYSTIMAYDGIEAVQRSEIQAALESDTEVPSEADAEALILDRSRSGTAGNAIPQAVLNNVQNTTGISPEEINELMNQQ